MEEKDDDDDDGDDDGDVVEYPRVIPVCSYCEGTRDAAVVNVGDIILDVEKVPSSQAASSGTISLINIAVASLTRSAWSFASGVPRDHPVSASGERGGNPRDLRICRNSGRSKR